MSRAPSPPPRPARRITPGLAPVLVLAGLLASGCPAPAPAPPEEPADLQASCGICHGYPDPTILPRERWRPEVEKMVTIAAERQIRMLVDPEEAIAWYEANAPEELPAAPGRTDAGPGPLTWTEHAATPPGGPPNPAVSNVRFLDVFDGPELELVVSDMRHGMVMAFDPKSPGDSHREIARLPHPCHVEVADLDGDGLEDLLVADLGYFNPTDLTYGQVVWLKRRPDDTFETVILAGNLGRVADIRPADLDGDGDLDLAVAVFGWREVGHVMWMENVATPGEQPSFESHVLDGRPGAIHVPVVDLDDDGDLDIIAVMAQEIEEVRVFLREGDGFEGKTLFAAPHPNWGFSGLEPVDFDEDGDLDLLISNGDTLDDHILKPYHGVAWLENVGDLRFEHRPITAMYGVHRALPVDVDADGDLDVLAAAFLPQFPEDEVRVPRKAEGVIWLERTGPDDFVRRVLEPVTADHATLDAADYDADGDLDLAVGNFVLEMGRWSNSLPRWAEIWENGGTP